ncbi:DEAD/DEAH box helicase [Micromonospora inaquosa]|uniref:DEAD/DEAH box helicase n=1 Tax=Micromonospora inaquosa TaxID=2203716 RepID=A0A3N9WI90_9ACTN|nr:DEAD/DEAH box helicase [Micromonospora inaquosa]RQX00501.1 DEAD/DEAH box helicase [Micromonospora inaquosa]
MRQNLRRWVADADTRQNVDTFRLRAQLTPLSYQEGRSTDLYFSLVGELFDLLRGSTDDKRDWATLGNALAQLSEKLTGAARSDSLLFSSVAFYIGGYSASAYLTMQQANPSDWPSEIYRACYDLIARPRRLGSQTANELLAALQSGRTNQIERRAEAAVVAAREALSQGPDEWVVSYVYASLIARFSRVNIRAVLPAGDTERWNPLVSSLLSRRPPVWDFFPSQVQAIEAGLLTSSESFSLQMPTGAGKTALTETLIFSHLTNSPGAAALLLVPYRALARELRGSLARRLSAVGLPTRTIYGGTVPTREETQDLEGIRVFIATPEAFTGLLSKSRELLSSISLVICDEGHLLDEGARGVGLELLLTRLRRRELLRPRMVFISAIVPNIEEINAWLGGRDETVVKSSFRPAEVEYAVLRPAGSGRRLAVGLQMQPVATTLQAHTLPGFLQAADFEYRNSTTGRTNTYPFSSIKTQAIATARKSLALGTVAVFAATKTGDQGVVGLAEELIKQIESGLPLPDPGEHVPESGIVREVGAYLESEYGADWIGTRALFSGAVVHHGDIPQETREAVEELLSRRQVGLVLCTSTLAEGINLPIRTLVLYSVQRRSHSGQPVPMFARDIRNLVGRAGRAGSSTKGLVICANPRQWPTIRPVAAGQPGEDVHGALRELIGRLQEALRRDGRSLSNPALEASPGLYPLVDGIDATLIELIQDELGDERFTEVAASLGAETFAAQQIDAAGQRLLTDVFTLRAQHITGLRATNRLAWVRETGAKARLLDSVVDQLAPSLADWENIDSPLNMQLLDALLAWAYAQPDFLDTLRGAYRSDDPPAVADLRALIHAWMAGKSFAEIAHELNSDIDTLLRVHASVVAHAFTTLVEQGISLLERYLADDERSLATAVVNLASYLRFGVATSAARAMMASGMRHRRAAVALGNDPAMALSANLLLAPYEVARLLLQDEQRWRDQLGEFVYRRTVEDVADNNSATFVP